jgi:hypothetical protein
MVQYTSENIIKERSMVSALIRGLMGLGTKGNGIIIHLKAMEFIIFQTKELILVNGKIKKKKDLANLYGHTRNIWGFIIMIRKMDLV